MVKYVENKFDEDYIQTLGTNRIYKSIDFHLTNVSIGVKLYGENHFIKKYGNNFQYMGFRWTKGVS